MSADDPRAALDALVTGSGTSYAALSRLLGRNAAYLQQYVRRGSPRRLEERDRATLAAYFGVDETVLGGRAAPAGVRRLDLAAAAGAGAFADDERAGATMLIDPALFAALKLDRTRAAIITARGDSMLPTIEDGDTMLVDERARTPGAAGGIFVIRQEGVLLVKRVAAVRGTLTAASDNPAYPPFTLDDASAIVGRVVWLSRALR